ncbi:hypothetical protein BC940DRAFT_168728 [Gongronella butleri]|nr:hypothetical protein BC940DRAFT_168728 [Gongronella butleri]
MGIKLLRFCHGTAACILLWLTVTQWQSVVKKEKWLNSTCFFFFLPCQDGARRPKKSGASFFGSMAPRGHGESGENGSHFCLVVNFCLFSRFKSKRERERKATRVFARILREQREFLKASQFFGKKERRMTLIGQLFFKQAQIRTLKAGGPTAGA